MNPSLEAPVGIWFIGARGSVATTATVGALALRAGLTGDTGVVGALPEVAAAGLPEVSDLVFGGHDLGTESLVKRAESLAHGGVLPGSLLRVLHHDLAEVERRLRPGLDPAGDEAQPAGIARVAADIADFREQHALSRVVVVDVSSTEAPADPARLADPAGPLVDPEALDAALAAGESPLPVSSAYALAAYRAGCPVVSFTPSPGPRLPVLERLAERAGLPWAGSDGKTGETLVKTALAPMFAARALRVRSWASYNMLGGGDGATLADPAAASSKTASKGLGLEAILGHPVDGPLHIDYVADHGDWKTAVDHVSFEGFLGVRMSLQFTWSGCDSALAAPLVLDLARLISRAHQAGRCGPQAALGVLLQGPGRHRRAPALRAVGQPRGLVPRAGRGRMTRPRIADLAELVRLPAALTVPGDSLAGATAAGRPLGRRGLLMPVASVSLYWAGMALNDYADRDLDRIERPERPIPSDRVRPGQAFALATALTATGLGAAAVAGGRRGLGTATVLAGVVWSYDLVLKDTVVGPVAMAAARGLDVLLGAAGAATTVAPAVFPAAVMAVHTAGVTVLSRGEVHGTRPDVARGVTAGTLLTAAAAAGAVRLRRPSAAPGSGGTRRVPAALSAAVSAALPVALSGLFAWNVGRAQAAAIAAPDAGTVRRATGAGIRGMIPLQAALAARGRLAPHGRGVAGDGTSGQGCLEGVVTDMSVRFGYGTNGFTSHRLEDALAVIAGLGYDGVALTLDHLHLDPFAADLPSRTAAVRRRLDELGLAVVVETGARYLLDPWRKHHPSLVSGRERERRVDYLERAVEVAADLGAEAMSFWSGTLPAGLDAETGWNRLVEGVGQVLDLAVRRRGDLRRRAGAWHVRGHPRRRPRAPSTNG